MRKPVFLINFEKYIFGLNTELSKLLRLHYGLWLLGVISFIESAIFSPIVIDPFLVAYILAHRTRVIAAVLITSLSSVAGGFVTYIVAAFFIDLIIGLFSPEAATTFYAIVTKYEDSSFVLAFLGAVTPIPFTLAALAAGSIKSNLLLFLLGSFVGRILRYGVVGYLTYKFGNLALTIAKKNLAFIAILTFILCGIYLIYRV